MQESKKMSMKKMISIFCMIGLANAMFYGKLSAHRISRKGYEDLLVSYDFVRIEIDFLFQPVKLAVS